MLSAEPSRRKHEVFALGRNPLLKGGAEMVPTDNAEEVSMAGMPQERRSRPDRRNAPVPQLGTVPLIIGLALGSPEFQRR